MWVDLNCFCEFCWCWGGSGSHLVLFFGARGTLSVAGRLSRRDHSYLLYRHAAVSRQRSGATPAAFPAFPSRIASPLLDRRLLFGENQMPAAGLRSLISPIRIIGGMETKRDQVTEATRRQFWGWWGVRSSWRLGNYSTVRAVRSPSSTTPSTSSKVVNKTAGMACGVVARASVAVRRRRRG